MAQRGWAEISRGPQRYHSTVYTRYYTTLHSLPLLPSSPPIPRYAARSYGAVPSRLASPNEKVANRVAIPHRRLVAMALRSCWAKGRRARSAGTWEDAVPSSCSFRTVQYSTVLTALCYTQSLLNSCSLVLPGEGLSPFPADSVPISVAGGSTQRLQHMRALEIRRAYHIIFFFLFAGSTGSEGSSGPGLPAARRLALSWAAGWSGLVLVLGLSVSDKSARGSGGASGHASPFPFLSTTTTANNRRHGVGRFLGTLHRRLHCGFSRPATGQHRAPSTVQKVSRPRRKMGKENTE